MNGLIIIILVSLFSLIADIVLKKSADGHGVIYLYLGMALYVLDAFLWFVAYKYSKFSTVGVMYSLLIIFATVAVGVFYFKERIGVTEIIGLVFGLIAIILLSGYK